MAFWFSRFFSFIAGKKPQHLFDSMSRLLLCLYGGPFCITDSHEFLFVCRLKELICYWESLRQKNISKEKKNINKRRVAPLLYQAKYHYEFCKHTSFARWYNVIILRLRFNCGADWLLWPKLLSHKYLTHQTEKLLLFVFTNSSFTYCGSHLFNAWPNSQSNVH